MYWIGDLDDQACRYKSKARKNIEKKIHKDTTFLFLVVLRLLKAVTLKPHCGGVSNDWAPFDCHLCCMNTRLWASSTEKIPLMVGVDRSCWVCARSIKSERTLALPPERFWDSNRAPASFELTKGRGSKMAQAYRLRANHEEPIRSDQLCAGSSSRASPKATDPYQTQLEYNQNSYSEITYLRHPHRCARTRSEPLGPNRSINNAARSLSFGGLTSFSVLDLWSAQER